jgi:hypothetical protein
MEGERSVLRPIQPPSRHLRRDITRVGRIARGAFVFACALGLAPFVAPAPVHAAEGLYLTWDDCALGPTATTNRTFACNSNSGQDELYCAFTMPAAANNVVSVEVVVDMQHSSAVVPDWWRLDGACRPTNNLAAAADFPHASCVDMWSTASRTAMIQGYTPSGNSARIKVTAWVLPQDAVTLDATSTYNAVRIIIHHDMTVGTPTCLGCDAPACLVLNSIEIGRVSGGNVFLQTPGTGDANWARWQGGIGADCAAVPVRARAWGQLKSQYR